MTSEEKAVRDFEVWAPQAVQRRRAAARRRARAPDPRRRRLVAASAPADPGTPYGFSLDGGDPRPDPRSRRQPDGPHGPSAVFDPTAFSWSDAQWTGVELAGSVIYELHVGTFTAEGTFDAAIDRLDHLVDLGVDLVELMPVAAFPASHGWGYDGVALYAVHEPYGGPDGAAAVRRRLPRHGPRRLPRRRLQPPRAGRQLPGASSARTSPTATRRRGARRSTSTARGSDEVRAFVVDNALMWLRDFHVDGLRLDAVHALYDSRALHVLEELSAARWTRWPAERRPAADR